MAARAIRFSSSSCSPGSLGSAPRISTLTTSSPLTTWRLLYRGSTFASPSNPLTGSTPSVAGAVTRKGDFHLLSKSYLRLRLKVGYPFGAGVTATGQRHTDGTRPVVATEDPAEA